MKLELKALVLPLRQLKRYYIADDKHRALHYVQGGLYWNKLVDWERVADCTSFQTLKEARDFAASRELPGAVAIRRFRVLIDV